MRIALATDWFAPRRGGIEAQLLNLAERLGAAGHHVDVLTATPGARDGTIYRVRSLAVARLPGVQLAASPLLGRHLRRELATGYDVVHAHVSVASPVGYTAALVAGAMRIPLVLTFHSVLRYKQRLLAAVDSITHVSRAPLVWSAVSELVGAQVGSALRDVPIAILPNGVETRFWMPEREREPSSAGRVVTFVTAMRLHRKKRPRQLLRAFAHLAARASGGARLLVAGDGPLRNVLDRDIRELGLARGSFTVELLGWQDAEALRDLYSAADAFVLPSMREAFGIAALEARAAGLPVIAMRASGSSEYLSHERDALLCENDAELTKAIGLLVDNVALRKRLSAAPFTLERYDWDAVLTRHLATYQDARRLMDASTAARSR